MLVCRCLILHTLIALVLLASSSISVPALALGREPPNYSVGVAGGYLSASELGSGPLAGAELSLLLDGFVWTSVGVRGLVDERILPLASVEAGIAFVGVGYTFAYGGDSAHWVHAFLGYPIVLRGITRACATPGLYLLPYYRPMLGLSSAEFPFGHEVGFMLKFTTLEVGSWSRAYDLPGACAK